MTFDTTVPLDSSTRLTLHQKRLPGEYYYYSHQVVGGGAGVVHYCTAMPLRTILLQVLGANFAPGASLSLRFTARGPGGGTVGGTPPAAAGVGAAAPALPEASAPAHVESTAHGGLATTASRPQQRQGRPGAPPRPGPASANQPARKPHPCSSRGPCHTGAVGGAAEGAGSP